MPNKHFYFAMGASTGVVVSWFIRKTRRWLLKHTSWMKYLYQWNRHWFYYFPVIILIFGLIAWTPDILHFFEILPKGITRSKFFNLFYFHSYFETLENENPSMDQILNWLGEILLFCIAFGILMFYALETRKLVNKRKKDKKD